MNRNVVGAAIAVFASMALAACEDNSSQKAAPQAAEDGAARSIDGKLQLSPSMPVFCLDDTGTYQPLIRTDLQRLEEGFERQFGWVAAVGGRDAFEDSQNAFWLHFAPSARHVEGEETISYVVEPHQGGIALLKMVARLNGLAPEVKEGTEMCGHTFVIINSAAP